MTNKLIGLPEEAAKWYRENIEKEKLSEGNNSFLSNLEAEQADAMNKLQAAVNDGLDNLRANVIADITAEMGIDVSKQKNQDKLREKNFKHLVKEYNTGNSLINQLPIDVQYALENDSEDETESPDYLTPVFEALSMAIDVIKEIEKIIANKQDSDTIKLANIGICLANKWEKNKEELTRKLSIIADYEKGNFDSNEPLQYNK